MEVVLVAFTCVDSFCGAGGLSIGLAAAGIDVVFGFDNDPRSIQTHALNPKYFSHRTACVDIAELVARPSKFITLNNGQQLFLLAGGPPCQGFSIQRIGEDADHRNDLVLQYANLIKKLKPAYFLMENVPGLEGKRGKATLDSAINLAESLDYWVHVKELDAQEFGVPQRRKRVFVVGESRQFGPALFEFPKPRSKRVTVRETIGHLPPTPDDGSDHPRWIHHRRDRLSDINKRRIAAIHEGQGRVDLPKELLSDCHRRDASLIGHRYVYGRMAWDEPAPTITARFDSFTRGKFGHPDQLRTISLREGALLQTFPKDFVFAGNKVEIARQIGNAVPPRLAKLLGQALLKCHRRKIRLGRVC